MEPLLNLLLLGLAIGLAVLVLSRGNAARRTVRQTQESLASGMQVMTGSGLFARVVEVEDAVVVLETAPGQHSRWDRRAIVRVIPDEPADDASAGTPADDARDEPDGPAAP